MKKLTVVLTIIFAFILGGCNFNNNESYLRIHIRANSNSHTDQTIKYEIKNLCVEYLSEYVPECDSKDEVITMLNTQKQPLKAIIDEFLCQKGFDYDCSISIGNEFFPTRSYGDLTLEEDYYDALIINLGSGTGDNWWCVVYPPLCFNTNSNVVYKSKIKELIESIWG